MGLLPVIIDLALVFIFIGSILDGSRKGFVRMVLSIIATIVGIVIAKEYSEPVAVWVEEHLIRNAAINSISEALSFHIGDTAQDAINALPDYIHNAARFAEVEMESLISGAVTQENLETATSAIYAAVKDFAIIPAAKIVAFFIIYAICNAILGVGISIVDKFFRLPILKGLNRVLGAALGGIKGVFVMFVVSAVIGFAAMLVPVDEFTHAVSEAELHQGIWETILSFLN